MICPYCRVSFHDEPDEYAVGEEGEEGDEVAWQVSARNCPTCGMLVLTLESGTPQYADRGGSTRLVGLDEMKTRVLIKPSGHGRPPCPPEVPADIAEDYNEACLVLADSPKASAALSRRCLQNLLRQKAGVKHGDLANEIQQVIDRRGLPDELLEEIDAIRNIGNFAAHPMKSTKSGEVVPVEPHEAEWNLEVLEGLFDYYFVQPAKAQKRREALNAKLAEAGKNPIKKPVKKPSN